MHRIDGYGATAQNLFTEGDPSGGIPPTRVTDDWLNDVQESLCAIAEAGGLVLAKGDHTQLAQLMPQWLNQWVTSGAGTSGDPWVVDVTSLNAWLATDGRIAVARVGYYQTDAAIAWNSTGSGIIGMSPRNSVITSTNTAEAVLKPLGRNPILENLAFGYDSLPANTVTTAIGLVLKSGDTDSVRFGTFRNLYISKVYTGIGEEAGAALSFNSVYENITVQLFSGWGAYVNSAASGDTLDAIYITNAGTGAQDCIGMFRWSGDHKSSIRQLNLEHAHCSDANPIRFGSGKMSVDGLHIEDITYSHTSPAVVEFVGDLSQIDVSNVELNSVVMNAVDQTDGVLFRFYGTVDNTSQQRIRVRHVRIWSDCDFTVSGVAAYCDLSNANGAGDEIFVEGFYDGSGSTFVPILAGAGGISYDQAAAVKQFADKQRGHIARNTALYDFAGVGGAIGNVVLDVLPRHTIVTNAWYEILDAFTSGGAATVAFGVETNDATGLKAPTAYNDAGYAAGNIAQFTPDGVVANWTTKTTNPRNLVMTIGGADLTAGKVRIWYETITSE